MNDEQILNYLAERRKLLRFSEIERSYGIGAGRLKNCLLYRKKYKLLAEEVQLLQRFMQDMQVAETV